MVWLSLIGGRLRVAKNSHEPSGCCFLTISSAISFRLCFCPSVQRGQRPCRDGQEREPHVQPSTLRARVGWISRIGKDLRGQQLVLAAQQGLGRIRQEFLVDRVPLPFGFAERPKRHRHVMAGGAFARFQPGGAFGLQISDGAIDRLLEPAAVLRREPKPVRRPGPDCERHSVRKNTANESVRAMDRSSSRRIVRRQQAMLILHRNRPGCHEAGRGTRTRGRMRGLRRARAFAEGRIPRRADRRATSISDQSLM